MGDVEEIIAELESKLAAAEHMAVLMRIVIKEIATGIDCRIPDIDNEVRQMATDLLNFEAELFTRYTIAVGAVGKFG